jgi:hypothetical protein
VTTDAADADKGFMNAPDYRISALATVDEIKLTLQLCEPQKAQGYTDSKLSVKNGEAVGA